MSNTIKAYLLANLFTVKGACTTASPGKNITDITPAFSDLDTQCGTYGDDYGQLAELFPAEFGPDVIKREYPNTSHAYGSSCKAVSLLGDDVYYYAEEKDGYSEWVAYIEAEKAGKSFVIMECLS